jgi:hypothetical protein
MTELRSGKEMTDKKKECSELVLRLGMVAYATEQREHAEARWARKAEENVQIQ